MKKITITCEHCGKTKIIKADSELIEIISTTSLILCQNSNCQHAYHLREENGFIRKVHFFGDFWSFDNKATIEELQGIWRANQNLRKALKEKANTPTITNKSPNV